MADIENVDRSITILVVDDQPLTRNMLKSILKGMGFATILQADNGAVAIQKLQSEPVDLIICDWNMPGVTGIDVLRTVRGTPATKDLCFLMLTAEAYRENVLAAVQAGVDDYVAKPFTPEGLGIKIANAVEARKRKNAAPETAAP